MITALLVKQNSTIFQFVLSSLFVFSQDGLSSLHLAARLGRDAIVKKLIHAEADINLRDQVSSLKVEKITFFRLNLP